MRRILLVSEELAYFKQIASQDYDEVSLLKDRLDRFKNTFKDNAVVAVDIETTHVDPRRGIILLSTWYFPEADGVVTVVHNFNKAIAIQELQSIRDKFKKVIVISHNAGFEYNWFTEYGLPRPREIWCTMVADQKLTQGMEGFRYNLVDTLNRRGVVHNIQKGISSEFAAMTDCKQLTIQHIRYNRDDTLPLHELYSKQQFLMRSVNQEFWIRRIHMPLVMILVDMEREGLVLNDHKWLQLAEKTETELAELDTAMHLWVAGHSLKSLDELVSSLGKELIAYNTKKENLKNRIQRNRDLLKKWTALGKQHLKAFTTTKDVMIRAIEQYKELNPPEHKINWNSSQQVLELLENLGVQKLPVGKSSTTHKYQPSLSKAAVQNWLLNNPSDPVKPLIELFQKYAKKAKRINSFGREFIAKYYRPETGKVHTSYKQGTVATGRLASGSADADPPTFNSQQLPREKELRECFGTDEGYFIVTCDLSGAELITMCSLAQDHRLLELSKQDMHSYFANKGWKAIYKSRGLVWTEQDIISQDQNKDKRTDYKPMTFGTIYGLKAKKAGETLNVSPKEGQIAINTIIQEIPETIKMVEAASEEALTKGYVIHNTRTNSRRYFRPVLDLLKINALYPPECAQELESGYSTIIAQAARNTRVQGTQGDILCESMVVLDRYIRFYNLDAMILLQVHDELAVKFHTSYASWFPARVKDVMIRTANRYLSRVEMDAKYVVQKTWTKD